jgi:hypothetical protein
MRETKAMAAKRYDFAKLSEKVKAALSAAFGDRALIELSEGYLGRVHVLLVTGDLNGKSDSEKQNFVWDILKAELGRSAQGVSLVIAYGTEELR